MTVDVPRAMPWAADCSPKDAPKTTPGSGAMTRYSPTKRVVLSGPERAHSEAASIGSVVLQALRSPAALTADSVRVSRWIDSPSHDASVPSSALVPRALRLTSFKRQANPRTYFQPLAPSGS